MKVCIFNKPIYKIDCTRTTEQLEDYTRDYLVMVEKLYNRVHQGVSPPNENGGLTRGQFRILAIT